MCLTSHYSTLNLLSLSSLSCSQSLYRLNYPGSWCTWDDSIKMNLKDGMKVIEWIEQAQDRVTNVAFCEYCDY
jgi:hypothetical protein